MGTHENKTELRLALGQIVWLKTLRYPCPHARLMWLLQSRNGIWNKAGGLPTRVAGLGVNRELVQTRRTLSEHPPHRYHEHP